VTTNGSQPASSGGNNVNPGLSRVLGTNHDGHDVAKEATAAVGWTIEIRNTLNSGVLPDGYYAMADQPVR
jgi:hypothetical protein